MSHRGGIWVMAIGRGGFPFSVQKALSRLSSPDPCSVPVRSSGWMSSVPLPRGGHKLRVE